MERTIGFLNSKLFSKYKMHKIQNSKCSWRGGQVFYLQNHLQNLKYTKYKILMERRTGLPNTKSSSKSKIHRKTGLVDTKSSKFKIQDTFDRSSALKTIMKNIIVTLFIL